jgi:tetratricopeptide (TPR) repeat protein
MTLKTFSIALVLLLAPCVAHGQGDQDMKVCDAEDAEAAIPACTRLIKTEKLDPATRSAALAGRATAYWRKQDYDGAIADANEAIQLNPNNSKAYARRGACYFGKGDHERALADTNKAIDIDPANFRAYTNRGIFYASRRDYERAIADATKAIQINPKFPNPYSVRGNAYQGKGDQDRAIADITKAIALDPKSGGAYVSRANIHVRRGDFERAIADATKAIEIDPNNARAYDNRGYAYWRKREDDLAIADATNAIAIDSKLINVYGYRAAAYERRGDHVLALADYDTLVATDPSNPKHAGAAALLRFVMGDFGAASAGLESKADVYGILFRYLARARGGDAADSAESELADKARRVGLSFRVWPYAFIELYLGQRSPDEMFKAAVKRTDRCLAHFYVGEWHLLRKEIADAASDLKAAAELCSRDVIEYRAAVAELARLKP